MSLINKLSWDRANPLSKYALLVISWKRYFFGGKNVFPLLSTYYSIASTAKAGKEKWNIWWLAFGMPLGLFCAWRYVRISDWLYEKNLALSFVFRSVEDLEVFQTTLRRRAVFWKPRYQEASRVINFAIRVLDDYEVAPHTKGLLYAARAECQVHLGYERYTLFMHGVREAAHFARLAASAGEEYQASRIFRLLSFVVNKDGDERRAKKYAILARRYAQGSADQLLKL